MAKIEIQCRVPSRLSNIGFSVCHTDGCIFISADRTTGLSEQKTAPWYGFATPSRTSPATLRTTRTPDSET
eukprot:6450250-Prymnesium_polylepis.1